VQGVREGARVLGLDQHAVDAVADGLGSPPARLAMTGRPRAIASSATRPSPSRRLGTTSTWAASMRSHRASRGCAGIIRTRPSSPAARSVSRPCSGPEPTRSRCTSSPSWTARPTASSRTSKPFSTDSRPAATSRTGSPDGGGAGSATRVTGMRRTTTCSGGSPSDSTARRCRSSETTATRAARRRTASPTRRSTRERSRWTSVPCSVTTRGSPSMRLASSAHSPAGSHQCACSTSGRKRRARRRVDTVKPAKNTGTRASPAGVRDRPSRPPR
jgi:hypothetical protein